MRSLLFWGCDKHKHCNSHNSNFIPHQISTSFLFWKKSLGDFWAVEVKIHLVTRSWNFLFTLHILQMSLLKFSTYITIACVCVCVCVIMAIIKGVLVWQKKGCHIVTSIFHICVTQIKFQITGFYCINANICRLIFKLWLNHFCVLVTINNLLYFFIFFLSQYLRPLSFTLFPSESFVLLIVTYPFLFCESLMAKIDL